MYVYVYIIIYTISYWIMLVYPWGSVQPDCTPSKLHHALLTSTTSWKALARGEPFLCEITWDGTKKKESNVVSSCILQGSGNAAKYWIWMDLP